MRHDPSQQLRTFVLVGHCGPDSFMLRTAIERSAPGAAVVRADDRMTLDRHLTPEYVLLINRVLDGHFAQTSGIDLIHDLVERTNGPSLVLISNLPSAQIEAEAAGAVPGFGKSQLYDDETRRRLAELAYGSRNRPLESAN